MQRIRDSIDNDCFPDFVRKFVRHYYAEDSLCQRPNETANICTEACENPELANNKYNVPVWVLNALRR